MTFNEFDARALGGRGYLVVLVGIILLAIAAVVGFKLWERHITTAPVGVYTQATVAPEVKLTPKVPIHPKRVMVYPQVATAHMKMPESMRNQAVLSASEIKSDPRPQTIVSTLNPDTGEVTTIVRRDPYKWMQAEQTGELRLSYGFRGMQRMARLSATEDVLQVKGVNLGGEVSLDQDGSHFAGMGIGWRW